jgi:hypothetical protein
VRTKVSSARGLYKKLASFKKLDSSGQTPEQKLLDYCRRVLGPVERLHIEFKEKSDRIHPTLEEVDRKNLAKAISGFANSGGGVLVWGIEDKTLAAKPITDIQLFVSSVLELAAQVTDPVVENIDGDWIESDASAGKDGFGLILIPESLLPPHRVLLSFQGIKNRYYIRTGGSFVEASHTQLKDMFGRRPQPELGLHTKVIQYGSRFGGMSNLFVILGIENKGRGTAKAPFLSIKISAPYRIYEFGLDGNSHFGLDRIRSSRGSQETKYGSSGDLVIHSGVVHEVTVVDVDVADINKAGGDVQDLVVDYKIAAEGTRLIEGRKVVRRTQLLDVAKQRA